jgi:hypothetical protein
MKKRKKKTNKELEKGIAWCMAEIYSQSLAIKALQSQINDLGDSHKE